MPILTIIIVLVVVGVILWLIAKRKVVKYTVTIGYKHCKEGSFYDCLNCPVTLAIKEQLPHFPVAFVEGDSLTDTFGRKWKFKKGFWCEWNYDIMCAILYFKVDYYKLTFYNRDV